MTYYADLTQYEYFKSQSSMRNVAWLDCEYDYHKAPVPHEMVYHLMNLAKSPQNMTRGFHTCNLCEVPPIVLENDAYYNAWSLPRRGNGEIHLQNKKGTFVAPVLIIHYITDHQYCPPQEFIDAVLEDYKRWIG